MNLNETSRSNYLISAKFEAKWQSVKKKRGSEWWTSRKKWWQSALVPQNLCSPVFWSTVGKPRILRGVRDENKKTLPHRSHKNCIPYWFTQRKRAYIPAAHHPFSDVFVTTSLSQSYNLNIIHRRGSYLSRYPVWSLCGVFERQIKTFRIFIIRFPNRLPFGISNVTYWYSLNCHRQNKISSET